tara:strand:- start:34 stop:741 length:708 start_codon:yes stop_codon:yes gene_type:complete
MNNKIVFKSIKFFNYPFKYIINYLTFSGGYLVAPAASSLSEINSNNVYYKSLKNSDVAIFDSGFFCLLLRLYKKKKVNKFSGYLFLKLLLDYQKFKNKKYFLINPNLKEEKKNKNLLRIKKIYNQKSYCAPKYNLSNYKDLKLLNEIKLFKPDIIIINLGGGIQEPLGEFLNNNLKRKTIIICTGAAIGFLTKVQAPITSFYDKYYLGWLVRLMHKPNDYFPRVMKSFNLLKVLK